MTQLTQINAQELQKNLFDSYEQFQEKAITKRRFGHATLVNLLEKLKSNPLFDVQIAEKSTEGRAIYQVKVGNGPTKVLLWSQMHGNEATATMALMDIFNFLGKDTPAYSDFKRTLLEKCTFYFVPMLNPDGAEAWSRYTALGIDMNRDALALQTPEGRLAEIIVLDQFSRNLYRDQPHAFAYDNMALILAQEAISLQLDAQLSPEQRAFLYMPFMHSESKLIHEFALKLFQRLGNEINLNFEKKHKVIIDRFGRYPHRNALLGRVSTPEELAFLTQPNSSF